MKRAGVLKQFLRHFNAGPKSQRRLTEVLAAQNSRADLHEPSRTVSARAMAGHRKDTSTHSGALPSELASIVAERPRGGRRIADVPVDAVSSKNRREKAKPTAGKRRANLRVVPDLVIGTDGKLILSEVEAADASDNGVGSHAGAVDDGLLLDACDAANFIARHAEFWDPGQVLQHPEIARLAVEEAKTIMKRERLKHHEQMTTMGELTEHLERLLEAQNAGLIRPF